MAMQHGWTPQMVNSLDPHFVEELSQRIRAENKIAEEREKEREREMRRMKQKRRRGIASRGRRP